MTICRGPDGLHARPRATHHPIMKNNPYSNSGVLIGRSSAVELLVETAERCEAGLMMLMMWALGVIVPTMCLLGLIDLSSRRSHAQPPGSAWEWATAIAALAGSSILGVIGIAATASAFSRRERPFGPAAAQRQRRLPIVLRWIPFLWWMAHFLFGAAIALGIERGGGGSAGSAHSRLVLGAFALLLTGAANIYLLLAVSAVAHLPRLIRGLWRWRFAIDLLIVTAAFIAPAR